MTDASPANALARHDKGGIARLVGIPGEKSAGRNDQNDKHKCCQEIDVSGVVAPMADFPAH
jgi:hypothetical protein